MAMSCGRFRRIDESSTNWAFEEWSGCDHVRSFVRVRPAFALITRTRDGSRLILRAEPARKRKERMEKGDLNEGTTRNSDGAGPAEIQAGV